MSKKALGLVKSCALTELAISFDTFMKLLSFKSAILTKNDLEMDYCHQPFKLSNIKPRPNDRDISTQHIATLLGATCCVLLATGLRCVACNMLGVVGSNLKLVRFEPTTPNMSQHGGQKHTTCCAQQYCDMLCWHVAIVLSGLYIRTIIR